VDVKPAAKTSSKANKKKNDNSTFIHFGDTWILSVSEDSAHWSPVPCTRSPPSRSGHRMLALNERFALLHGGFRDTGKQCYYFDDTWIFDLVKRQWICVNQQSSLTVSDRPCPRSGAILFNLRNKSQESTFEVHLYGGYATEGKGDSVKGVVLRQHWVLSLDINVPPEDSPGPVEGTWRLLKTPGGAPPPRSGISGVVNSVGDTLVTVGGISDTETPDLLLGTCSNDVHTLRMGSPNKSVWTWVYPSPDTVVSPLIPRYNAMLLAVPGTNKVIVYGGMCEVGDHLFTLDDTLSLSLDESGVSIDVITPLSGDILERINEAKSLGYDSLSSDESESDGNQDSDEDSDEDSDDDNDQSSQTEQSVCKRQPNPMEYESLKDFFDQNMAYWLRLARTQLEASGSSSVDEKSTRSAAFALARRSWDLVPPSIDSVKL